MNQIYLSGQTYRPVGSDQITERTYETMLVNERQVLFPGLLLSPFKVDVSDGETTKRPDFALVDRSYRRWWVVEVELSHHSWAHVEEQVRVFANGNYKQSHADYLHEGCGDIEIERLRDLMVGANPTVAVIVHGNHHQTSKWQEGLSPFAADFSHIDVYRSGMNQHALVASGTVPSADNLSEAEMTVTCTRHRWNLKWLVVENPAMLGISDGAQIDIDIRSEVSSWARKDLPHMVILVPTTGDPLSANEISKSTELRLQPTGEKTVLTLREGKY
jgi:hypothetical protein